MSEQNIQSVPALLNALRMQGVIVTEWIYDDDSDDGSDATFRLDLDRAESLAYACIECGDSPATCMEWHAIGEDFGAFYDSL